MATRKWSGTGIIQVQFPAAILLQHHLEVSVVDGWLGGGVGKQQRLRNEIVDGSIQPSMRGSCALHESCPAEQHATYCDLQQQKPETLNHGVQLLAHDAP